VEVSRAEGTILETAETGSQRLSSETVRRLEAWLSLPEGDRAELLGGRIVYKAMASIEHGDAVMGIAEQLGRFRGPPGTPGGWWLSQEVDMYLAGQGLRPDMVGWRMDRHPLPPQKVNLTYRHLSVNFGSPSPSTTDLASFRRFRARRARNSRAIAARHRARNRLKIRFVPWRPVVVDPKSTLGVYVTPPDWVCEVLSSSTRSRDEEEGLKWQAYYEAGVGHYWLVDLLRRQLTVYKRGARDYEPVEVLGREGVKALPPFETTELVAQRVFLLADLIGQGGAG